MLVFSTLAVSFSGEKLSGAWCSCRGAFSGGTDQGNLFLSASLLGGICGNARSKPTSHMAPRGDRCWAGRSKGPRRCGGEWALELVRPRAARPRWCLMPREVTALPQHMRLPVTTPRTWFLCRRLHGAPATSHSCVHCSSRIGGVLPQGFCVFVCILVLAQ